MSEVFESLWRFVKGVILHSRALKLFLCDSVSTVFSVELRRSELGRVPDETGATVVEKLPWWLLGGQDGLVRVVGLHNYT